MNDDYKPKIDNDSGYIKPVFSPEEKPKVIIAKIV